MQMSQVLSGEFGVIHPGVELLFEFVEASP
jgi:hypothetical protein